VFSQPSPDNPRINYLYGIDPVTGESRRVYPPQEITALHCPDTIRSDAAGTVRISIANSGLRQADVHVLLRASNQRFPYASKLNSNVIRSESVQVPADAIETVDWPVTAQNGLSTHISVVINPDATLPMDEERCVARNTSTTGCSACPTSRTSRWRYRYPLLRAVLYSLAAQAEKASFMGIVPGYSAVHHDYLRN